MYDLSDDYYEFLGVKRTATSDEIRRICDDLIIQYQVDADEDVQVGNIVKRIFEIKCILSDSDKRDTYDRLLNEINKATVVAKDEEKHRRESEIVTKRQLGKTSFCDYCGKDFGLPFKCHMCGGKFCGEHHLPESHECPIIWVSEEKYSSIKLDSTHVYQENIMCPIKRNNPRCYDKFDCKNCDDPEVKDICKRYGKHTKPIDLVGNKINKAHKIETKKIKTEREIVEEKEKKELERRQQEKINGNVIVSSTFDSNSVKEVIETCDVAHKEHNPNMIVKLVTFLSSVLKLHKRDK